MTTTEMHPTDALNAKVKAMTDAELLAASGAPDRQTRYQAEKEMMARCPFKYPTPEMAHIQTESRVLLDLAEAVAELSRTVGAHLVKSQPKPKAKGAVAA